MCSASKAQPVPQHSPPISSSAEQSAPPCAAHSSIASWSVACSGSVTLLRIFRVVTGTSAWQKEPMQPVAGGNAQQRMAARDSGSRHSIRTPPQPSTAYTIGWTGGVGG